MLLFRSLLLLAAVLLPFSLDAGVPFNPERDVAISFSKGTLTLVTPPNSHLKQSFMQVELKSKPGAIKVGPLPPTDAKDEIGDGIWHGTVRIPVSGEGLQDPVELDVTYQPCTEGEGGVCFAPTTRTLKPLAAEFTAATGSSSSPLSQGLLLTLFFVFLAGMGASLTPCVYPMIPITMAIIGAKGGGKAKGFALSAMLVLGMALTYTVLGVVAAKAGGIAAAWAQKPAFLIPVSILFAIFALSLFGAFEIALPAGLAAKLQGSGARKGFGGAFVMGMVLGPISAPCVGPIIGTVLVDIAQKGQVYLGGLKLFVFALGMGVLFLLVGTFSAALPKSGDWLTRFKQGMGLVVLGFAAWNVRLVVPEWANYGMWTFVTLVGAATFGAFEAAEGFVGQLRKAFGLLLLVCGVLLGLRALESNLKIDLLPRGGAAAAPKDDHAGWLEQDYEGALQQAKAGGKLVLVDIYADWCAQCKELDENTWPDAGVKAWITKNAVALRLDTDAKRKDLAGTLQIRSYPTVLLLDGDGKEVGRILGFQKPPAMLAFLQGVRP